MNEVNEIKEEQITAEYHFASALYWVNKPEYLETSKTVADEYLKASEKSYPKNALIEKLYPVVMSDSFHEDKRIADLANFIGETSWGILSEQGYAMESYELFFMDFWAQEHHMGSSNEEHVHGFGCQMTGFYILEAPEDCSKICIFDPRSAKKQINLYERNINQPTYASLSINFNPKPGNLYFLNAALPHGFSKHASEKPLKFIHFNMGVRFTPPPTTTATEII